MRIRSLVLGLVLIAAILLNAVQFRSIDAQTVPFFRALHRADTADLTAQMRYDCGWCRQRYDLHLALAVVAPSARVVVPSPSQYTASQYTAEELRLRLRTFGQARRVDWVAYPARPPAGFDPTPYVVASGPGGARGAPWLLAADPAHYRATGDPDGFVDRAMAGELSSGPPGRTFVLLRWDRPRPGSGASHQDLAVELSLLPEAMRRELAP